MLTREEFFSEERQPRAVAYMKATNAEHFRGYEYIKWINDHIIKALKEGRSFVLEMNLGSFRITDNDGFTAYLKNQH